MKQILDWVRPAIKVVLNNQQSVRNLEEETLPKVSMHLNENPFGSPQNRYLSKSELPSRTIVGQLKGGVHPQCVSLANGTTDAIERLMRTFCTPMQDNVIVVEPTSGLYSHVAQVNDIEVRHVSLDAKFQLDVEAVMRTVGQFTKMVFLASPNNPTGNLLSKESILQLCDQFEGIVVVDEAFIEFSRSESLVKSISSYHNLVVVSSFSIAYALASSRISAILAHPLVIRAVEVLRHCFTLNAATLAAIESLPRRRFEVDKWVKSILEERSKLMLAVAQLPISEKVYPTSSNFFLVRFKDGEDVYKYLSKHGIAVYNCSHIAGCENCLRITVSLPMDNNALVSALRLYCERVK